MKSGQGYKLGVFITSDGASDIESLFVKHPDATGLAGTGKCYDVTPNQENASPVDGWFYEVNVPAAYTPASSGQQEVEVSSHGIDGEPADNGCFTAADDTDTFADQLSVSSTGTSLGGTVDSLYDQLLAMIQALTLQVQALTQANQAPPKPAYCSSRVVYNGSNAWAAQAWLLSQPLFNSGFYSAGVYQPTGFWGKISQAASAQADVACR